jgi:hypothetical protein
MYNIISKQNGNVIFTAISAEVVDNVIEFVLEGREDETLFCPADIAYIEEVK